MKKSISSGLIYIGVLLIISAAVFACFTGGAGVAFALEYDDVELSSLWYYGEGGLEIDKAKARIDKWDKGKLSKKVIAVIDTGIDFDHEVFSGVLYTDADGKPAGYDSRYKKQVPLENMKDTADDKHGNAIAGVIAMMIKELGLEDFIKIYPIKANTIENGKEKKSFVIPPVVEALNQADKIGADAVNMSLGRIKKDSSDWATNTSLTYALESACDRVLIVAAAGNDGLNADGNANNVFYPAAHDGVLSVMAYDKSGLYEASNYGSVYDIAGPGDEIYTAKFTEGALYQYLNGTSLASPIATVAGVLLKLRYEAEGKPAPKGVELARMMRNIDGRVIKKEGAEIRCLDFNTIVTQDFENTKYEYSDPTGISLSHNGEYGKDAYEDIIYMRANAVKPVTFIAKINPFGKTDPELDAAVQWVERHADTTENVLGYGIRFNYTPKHIDETVTLIARLRYGDKTFEQSQDVFLSSVAFMVGEARVTYAENAADSVDNAPSRGVLYTNTTTVFSLTGIEYVSEEKKSKIQWYVDGELAGEGETFAYTPKKSGVRRISARYDGSPIPREFIANVKPFIARPLDLAMLILGLAIASAVIAVVIVIAVKRKRKSGDGNDSDDNQQSLIAL